MREQRGGSESVLSLQERRRHKGSGERIFNCTSYANVFHERRFTAFTPKGGARSSEKVYKSLGTFYFLVLLRVAKLLFCCCSRFPPNH